MASADSGDTSCSSGDACCSAWAVGMDSCLVDACSAYCHCTWAASVGCRTAAAAADMDSYYVCWSSDTAGMESCCCVHSDSCCIAFGKGRCSFCSCCHRGNFFYD